MTSELTAVSVTNTALVFITLMPTPTQALALPGPTLSFRVNEASAAAVSLAIGVALSAVSSDGMPLLMAAVTALAIVGGYEYLVRVHNARIETERIAGYEPNRRI